jgi:hypothetical protein
MFGTLRGKDVLQYQNVCNRLIERLVMYSFSVTFGWHPTNFEEETPSSHDTALRIPFEAAHRGEYPGALKVCT